jgi:hypothetical protein
MQIAPPKIGQTYCSSTDPKLIIYVVDVIDFAEDADSDIAFIVEGCDPAYQDDTMNADGCEITSDVWAKHNFIPVSEK